jgi:hypothetical protein
MRIELRRELIKHLARQRVFAWPEQAMQKRVQARGLRLEKALDGNVLGFFRAQRLDRNGLGAAPTVWRFP